MLVVFVECCLLQRIACVLEFNHDLLHPFSTTHCRNQENTAFVSCFGYGHYECSKGHNTDNSPPGLRLFPETLSKVCVPSYSSRLQLSVLHLLRHRPPLASLMKMLFVYQPLKRPRCGYFCRSDPGSLSDPLSTTAK